MLSCCLDAVKIGQRHFQTKGRCVIDHVEISPENNPGPGKTVALNTAEHGYEFLVSIDDDLVFGFHSLPNEPQVYVPIQFRRAPQGQTRFDYQYMNQEKRWKPWLERLRDPKRYSNWTWPDDALKIPLLPSFLFFAQSG